MKYVVALLLITCAPLQGMEANKWDGDNYHENSKPQFDKAMAYLKGLSLRTDEHILDVGCGSGKVTAEIARLVPQGLVVGVDSSESMITTARKEFGKGNAAFQAMKAEELTFDNRFDRIVSFATFHWIKDKEAAFKKCAQALKQDGTLHIRTSGATAFAQPGTVAFFKIMQQKKWQEKLKGANLSQYLFPIDENEAKRLLSVAHLEAKEITLTTEHLASPSVASFKQFIAGFAKGAYPFFGGLKAEEQADLLEDYAKEYVQLIPVGPDGAIDYPVLTLTIVASKK